MLLMATLGIQVLVATVYANLFEWLWHKHVYHGLGKKKKSWFSGHWRDHHRVVRKSKGFDLSYNNRLFVGKDPTLEAVQLFVAASLHLPLLPLAPAFVATLACAMYQERLQFCRCGCTRQAGCRLCVACGIAGTLACVHKPARGRYRSPFQIWPAGPRARP